MDVFLLEVKTSKSADAPPSTHACVVDSEEETGNGNVSTHEEEINSIKSKNKAQDARPWQSSPFPTSMRETEKARKIGVLTSKSLSSKSHSSSSNTPVVSSVTNGPRQSGHN